MNKLKVMNVSYEEKLINLGLLEYKDKLSPEIVDILYSKYFGKDTPEMMFKLLNHLLVEAGYNKDEEKKEENKEDKENKKQKIVLELLNDLLEEVGYNTINNIEDFKIIVADLKELDGGKFVDNHLDKLKEANIDPIKDLDYALKDKRKKYSLNVLKGIVGSIGYRVVHFSSQAKIEGNYKSVLKYRLEQI